MPGVVVLAGAATPIAHLLAAGTAVVLVDPDAAALARVAETRTDARLAPVRRDPEEGLLWGGRRSNG